MGGDRQRQPGNCFEYPGVWTNDLIRGFTYQDIRFEYNLLTRPDKRCHTAQFVNTLLYGCKNRIFLIGAATDQRNFGFIQWNHSI